MIDLMQSIADGIVATCWRDESFPCQAEGAIIFAHGAVASPDDFARAVSCVYLGTSPADCAWGTTCKVSATVRVIDVSMTSMRDGRLDVAATLEWRSS